MINGYLTQTECETGGGEKEARVEGKVSYRLSLPLREIGASLKPG